MLTEDTVDTNRSSFSDSVKAVLGCIVIFGLMIVYHFFTDTLPFFFRTTIATVGLDDQRADLLENLNDARSRTLADDHLEGIVETDGIDARYGKIWNDYHQAVTACQQAELAPWRIKLAGGKYAVFEASTTTLTS